MSPEVGSTARRGFFAEWEMLYHLLESVLEGEFMYVEVDV